MTTNGTNTTSTYSTGDGAALFAETNFGVQSASGEQAQTSAADAEERARAWRAILQGNLL